jgi:transglutaminase-like putative cysteine protease
MAMQTTKKFTGLIVKINTNMIVRNAKFTQYLVAAASLFICILLLSITALGAYTLLPAKVHYHIAKKFSITQHVGEAQIYLGLLLPKTGSYQVVDDVSVLWDGNQETSSRAYVDLLKLSAEMPGESEKVAVVEYGIVLRQGTAAWRAPVDRIDLLPQVGIESNHEDIKQAASRITAEASNDPAYEIFQFTSNYLEYSETGCEDTNLSALEAFRTRSGACIAYSRLMVALCRASGIPAKMIIGTLLPDGFFSLPQVGASSDPGSGHAWVEYNSQNSWHLADPSCGQSYPDVLAFNRNDGRHLSFGDYDRFAVSKDELYDWATEHASPRNTQLTSVFASNSEQTEITSETTIRKTWDQRWLNVIVALIIAVFILSKLRDRILSKYFPD